MKISGVVIPNTTYKSYTALITQYGTDNLILVRWDDIPGGPDLIIGRTYRIMDNTGSDFTNVGAPNNNIGTYFVATGIRPNNWGEAILQFNTGAPIVTVLENTIGNIWFTYNLTGNYYINSNDLFTLRKTTAFISTGAEGVSNGIITGINVMDQSVIACNTVVTPATPIDDELYNTPIEIRVYN